LPQCFSKLLLLLHCHLLYPWLVVNKRQQAVQPHLTLVMHAFAAAAAAAAGQVAIWGWVVVSAIVMCVALNMAELSSAYTTSGGMY
jgi:hypothetical protein